ncbi:ABC transporter permease [Gordonia desulfuricans]|uniref:ABC transporter permease n=1 Tax=Gordonia desulfuricans TaxID=89051 RepID=A0A7K3LJP8_9ACTN|nr:ABC transporter permease [Gordonia desulfuricans]NDK88291.1 ABC transporter permease [Gordonia desulfuricans]
MLLAVLTLVFAAVDFLPGNAARAALGRDATPEQVAAYEHALGLDRPLAVRYVDWLGGLLTGDLGTTVRGIPIGEVVSTKMPNTLLLGGLALVVTALVTVAGGAVWALRPRGISARVLSPSTTMMIAVPEFVVATMLVFVFSLGAGWFPAVTITNAAGAPASPSMLVLPVLALAIPQSAWNIRVARAALVDASGSPHVSAAELDGLGQRHILFRHVFPIALPTIATSLATSVGMLLGGALVVETIFNYPGIGSVLAGSVADRDAVLVASVVALPGAAITVILLAADLLRVWAVRGR